MSLRPLLDIALDDERFRSLAGAARDGRTACRSHISACDAPVPARRAGRGRGGASAAGPLLVVAADDIGARDLARELRAYLAPRRVRYYPSRGTGYASHLTPPPHLVGLRIGALDALARAASRPSWSPAPSRSPRRSRTPRFGPAGFTLERGEEVDLGGRRRAARRGRLRARRPGRGARPVRDPRRHPRRLPGHRGARRAAGAVRRRDRVDPLVLDLHPALAGRGRRDRARRRPPSSRSSTASWPSSRSRTSEERPRTSAASSCRSTATAPSLDLIPDEAAIVVAEEIEAGAARPLGGRDRRRCTTTTRAASTSTSPSRWPSARRCSISTARSDEELWFRVLGAELRRRAASAEAESRLEQELGAGYRVVVAFEHRGEAERARYNLNRLDAQFLDASRRSPPRASGELVLFAEAPLSEGFVAPELKLAVIPFRRLVHRRRAAAPPPPAAGWPRSPTCGSATTSSTRTTASPASPASRRRRSAASPATTSSSSTAARTGSSRPPTS